MNMSPSWALPFGLFRSFSTEKGEVIDQSRNKTAKRSNKRLDDDDGEEEGNEGDEFGEDDILLEALTDDELDFAMGDDSWDDEMEPAGVPERGDGEDGGGVRLGDAPWGKLVLQLVEEEIALPSYQGDLALYGLRVVPGSGLIRVRLDKLSDKYGSPTLEDVARFTRGLDARVEHASLLRKLPSNLSIEVSSPGAERVLTVPEDLERFKSLPMSVRYRDGPQQESERDAVFDVVEWDEEKTVWKLANVRANREALGKGRVLTKKMREARVEIPIAALLLVRLHFDI